jgi:hypothetical protein
MPSLLPRTRRLPPAASGLAPAPLRDEARASRRRHHARPARAAPQNGCRRRLRRKCISAWGGLSGKRSHGFMNRNGWCCQTGLNCRPLHYQWSALPLSYGSMPRRGNQPHKAPPSCRSLPQGYWSRKRGTRRRAAMDRRYEMNCPIDPVPSQPASARPIVANPVPHPLNERLQRLHRPDHGLEFDHFPGVARSPADSELCRANGLLRQRRQCICSGGHRLPGGSHRG